VFNQTISNFEFISLDNSSTDGTLEIVKKYNKDGKIFNIPKGEYVPGKVLNLGVSEAKGDTIVFLNSDAIPADRYWLEELIKPLDDEKVGAVYGRQIARDDAYFLVEQDYLRTYPPKKESYMSDLMFSFATASFKKSVWEKHKFYDYKIGYAEDMEWCSRVLKDNVEMRYTPSAKVIHSHNLSLKKLYFKTYWEFVPASIIYPQKINFFVLFKRFLVALIRDFISSIKSFKLLSIFYALPFRTTIFLASYNGFRRGLREKIKA